MSQQQETRPFSLIDAQAGAPYACRDGRAATILKWDARSERYPLVGVKGENDEACTWAENGKYDLYQVHNQSSDLLMTSLGEIDGKPVFVGDDLESEGPEGWAHCKAHPTTRDFTNCRWPTPEKQYPVTGMTDDELQRAVDIPDQSVLGRARNIANAALRHAIDNGTVVIPHKQAARDMAIAEAVRLAAAQCAEGNWRVREHDTAQEIAVRIKFTLDLPAIIAKVP